ncbi:hypothetical protein H6F42_21480 [Pseudanabaena sp. FACHB-1998]|uniref:hypothetical protein n=1 Tax=Pseudanabaena sp. FACHB-1998 TaxID=2692858 RepID=UPI0016805CED|nr:hypothetical protein [Pseudanabaena sp. FACHB-1998]MBD2179488.1 hypothetical protein [Pseudanabaena sp. FACHB-1998]
MIENLEHKIKNEKYHKSVRYFSHFLKGEKRCKYISEVAKYNIYLAAQCIMSCEEDNDLENSLACNALDRINSNIVKEKANGFLALLELNRFDLIYDAISQISRIRSIDRYTINQIFEELDEEGIVKFLKIVLKAEVKGLISSIIYNVLNRNVSFNASQKKELEELFKQLVKFFGPYNGRILKFIFAFKLSKNLIPANINLMAERFIVKPSEQEFIRSFYEFYDIPFPFSNVDLCNLCLNSRNRPAKVIAFSKFFFDISNIDIQIQLLEKALLKGKYFTGFVISLINDADIRDRILKQYPDEMKDFLDLFVKVEHPKFDQDQLLTTITKISKKDQLPTTITKISKQENSLLGKTFKCKVTVIIPKTIFVELISTDWKGSIYIKEFTKEYIEDAHQIVSIGDEFDAVVIGFHHRYLQLSVNELPVKK